MPTLFGEQYNCIYIYCVYILSSFLVFNIHQSSIIIYHYHRPFASHPAFSSHPSLLKCKKMLAKFCHFPLLKLYQHLKVFKLTKGTYPSHRPHHPLIVGTPPLLIKPTLWPPSCFPSLSSRNPLSFPNHVLISPIRQEYCLPISFIDLFPNHPNHPNPNLSQSCPHLIIHHPSSGHHLY